MLDRQIRVCAATEQAPPSAYRDQWGAGCIGPATWSRNGRLRPPNNEGCSGRSLGWERYLKSGLSDRKQWYIVRIPASISSPCLRAWVVVTAPLASQEG